MITLEIEQELKVLANELIDKAIADEESCNESLMELLEDYLQYTWTDEYRKKVVEHLQKKNIFKPLRNRNHKTELLECMEIIRNTVIAEYRL